MMQGRRFACLLGLTAVVSLGAGCLPSVDNLDTGPLTSTFAVSDYFAPSGYMGDGMFFGKLSGTANEGCRSRAGQGRGNCYAFTYWPNDVGVDPWAGVFWVYPSNSWGSISGRAIDISKFKQISFWAALDGPTPYTDQGTSIPFNGQAGGIDPLGRYADKGGLDYVDGVNVKYGWTVGAADGITNEWKQFHIPLGDFEKSAGCQEPDMLAAKGKAANCTGTQADFLAGNARATFVIGAFAFAVHYPSDASQCQATMPNCHAPLDTRGFYNPPPVHIYLDDIVWETEATPTP